MLGGYQRRDVSCRRPPSQEFHWLAGRRSGRKSHFRRAIVACDGQEVLHRTVIRLGNV
jgi:hypothetical protein